MDCLDFIQIFKDLSIGISALLAAIFGAKALDQWRKELKGSDQYKIAKEIGFHAIQVADRLHLVRSHFKSDIDLEKYVSDRIDNTELPNDLSKDWSFQQERAIHLKVQWAQESLTVLKQLNWGSQVIGIEITDNLNEFSELIRELGYANNMIHTYHDRFALPTDRFDGFYKTIFGISSDEIGTKIESIKTAVLSKIGDFL